MLKTIKVKPEATAGAVGRGYILATDLADYLTQKGEPFRKAHEIVGQLVSYAADAGKSLAELGLEEYRQFSPLFAEDVHAITVESSLAARDVAGGTAPKQVRRALSQARRIIKEYQWS